MQSRWAFVQYKTPAKLKEALKDKHTSREMQHTVSTCLPFLQFLAQPLQERLLIHFDTSRLHPLARNMAIEDATADNEELWVQMVEVCTIQINPHVVTCFSAKLPASKCKHKVDIFDKHVTVKNLTKDGQLDRQAALWPEHAYAACNVQAVF